MESLGNDDVSPLNSPKYEIVRDDVKQKIPEGTACSVTFSEATILKLLTNAIYIS